MDLLYILSFSFCFDEGREIVLTVEKVFCPLGSGEGDGEDTAKQLNLVFVVFTILLLSYF